MRKRDYRELEETKRLKDIENKENEQVDYSKDIHDSIRVGCSVGMLILFIKSSIEILTKNLNQQEHFLLKAFILGFVYFIFRLEFISYVEFGAFETIKKSMKIGLEKWGTVLLLLLLLCLLATITYFGLTFTFSSWKRIFL